MRENGPLKSTDYESDFWLDYLERIVFFGLTPVEVKFSYGTSANKFFCEADFLIVIDRIRNLGIGVLGMHTCTDIRCDLELYEWRNYEMKNKEWIPFAFKRLKEKGNDDLLYYMADLHIFDEQLYSN